MEIKSLRHFSCAYDLLMEDCDVEIMAGLSDDEIDFLRHVDDYEPVSLFLLNDDTVIICDSISGDVMGESLSIPEFMQVLHFSYIDLCAGNGE